MYRCDSINKKEGWMATQNIQQSHVNGSTDCGLCGVQFLQALLCVSDMLSDEA